MVPDLEHQLEKCYLFDRLGTFQKLIVLKMESWDTQFCISRIYFGKIQDKFTVMSLYINCLCSLPLNPSGGIIDRATKGHQQAKPTRRNFCQNRAVRIIFFKCLHFQLGVLRRKSGASPFQTLMSTFCPRAPLILPKGQTVFRLSYL